MGERHCFCLPLLCSDSGGKSPQTIRPSSCSLGAVSTGEQTHTGIHVPRPGDADMPCPLRQDGHKDTLVPLSSHVKSHRGSRDGWSQMAEHFPTPCTAQSPSARQVSLEPHQVRLFPPRPQPPFPHGQLETQTDVKNRPGPTACSVSPQALAGHSVCATHSAC